MENSNTDVSFDKKKSDKSEAQGGIFCLTPQMFFHYTTVSCSLHENLNLNPCSKFFSSNSSDYDENPYFEKTRLMLNVFNFKMNVSLLSSPHAP